MSTREEKRLSGDTFPNDIARSLQFDPTRVCRLGRTFMFFFSFVRVSLPLLIEKPESACENTVVILLSATSRARVRCVISDHPRNFVSGKSH